MSKKAWYTFGNHFHWVDMQWLWGYRVLTAGDAELFQAYRDALRARNLLDYDDLESLDEFTTSCDSLVRLRPT